MALAAKEVTRLIPKNKFKLEECKKRITWCPVRGRDVAEYCIPIELITQDEKSQNRETGSDQAKIASIANEFLTTGQDLGICVFHDKEKPQPFLVRWGNTRYRSADSVYDRLQNNEIIGCDPGCIWVSLYEEKLSELSRLQAKENNVHKTATPASLDDNARSLRSIVDSGLLDEPNSKFADLGDEQKKERIREEVKQTMPHWKGKKFDTLWGAFRNKNSSLFQTKSFTTGDKKKYFEKHNDYGITSIKNDKAKDTGPTTAFAIGEKNEEEYVLGVFFVHNTVLQGASLQGSYSAKNIKKHCDKILWVCDVKVNKSSELNSKRDLLVDEIKEWNAAQDNNFVDRVIFVPQTVPEGQAADIWIKDTSFK